MQSEKVAHRADHYFSRCSSAHNLNLLMCVSAALMRVSENSFSSIFFLSSRGPAAPHAACYKLSYINSRVYSDIACRRGWFPRANSLGRPSTLYRNRWYPALVLARRTKRADKIPRTAADSLIWDDLHFSRNMHQYAPILVHLAPSFCHVFNARIINR